MLDRFPKTLITSVLVLLATITINRTFVHGKGKPGGGQDPPPPPPPPGLIYFSGAVDGQVSTYEMVPDGSTVQHLAELDGLGDTIAPTFAKPYGTGFPSTFRYGADGHRWWIYFKLIRIEPTGPNSARYYHDLFASPDGVTEIQVTNFSDYDIMLGNNSEPPAWSTGSDSFLSFSGVDVIARVDSLYRIHVGAADLEAELAGTTIGAFPVLPTDPLRTEIVVAAPTLYAGNFRHHAWSPDGDQVVFVMDDGTSVDRETLWRLDLDSGFAEPIFADNISTPHIRWSPDGRFIAVADVGDIMVMDPNVPGSEMVVVDGSLSSTYSHPLWAPDGSQIAFLQQSYNKRFKQDQYKIYSISLADSSLREIDQYVDPLSYKRLLDWTAE